MKTRRSRTKANTPDRHAEKLAKEVLEKCVKLLQEHEDDRAVRVATEAINKIPAGKALGVIYVWLGMQAAVKKRNSEAIHFFRFGEQNDPTDFTAKAMLAKSFSDQPGEEAQAVKKAKEALKLARSSLERSRVYLVLAKSFLRMGRYDNASKALARYRLAWSLSREKMPDLWVPDFELLEQFIAAGLSIDECRKICLIAIRRGRRDRIFSSYRKDLDRLLYMMKAKT
jgi:hypothetical protein